MNAAAVALTRVECVLAAGVIINIIYLRSVDACLVCNSCCVELARLIQIIDCRLADSQSVSPVYSTLSILHSPAATGAQCHCLPRSTFSYQLHAVSLSFFILIPFS